MPCNRTGALPGCQADFREWYTWPRYTKNGGTKSMNRTTSLRWAGILGLIIGAAAWGQDEKPWALRDHYEVTYGPTAFGYDVNTSEWQIDVEGLGLIFKNVQSEVELGDGQVIRLSDQKMDHDERQAFEDNFGKGSYFRSVYKPDSGVSLRYSLKQFSNRAFMHLQMEVRNDSDAPIEIAAIRPAVMLPGSITKAAEQCRVDSLHVSQRGGIPTLNDGAAATLILMELRSANVSIGLGVLPSGTCDAAVNLDQRGQQWTGSVGMTYSPPLTLAPGDSVRADPLWLGFSEGVSQYIQESYSWCHSVLPSARRALDVPPTWVTMAETEPVERLYAAARAWREYNVNAAVVPGSWEREPGTLRPRMPQYPSDIRTVVESLRGIGVQAGVVYDPLAAGEAKSGTIVTANDGSRWFTPSSRDAVDAAAAHARRLTDLGFHFFIVQPSAIPDDALRQAGITRNEADMFAFGVLTQAAGTRPVFPSAAMSLADDLPRWQAVASTTEGYTAYGLVPGPIQLNAQRLQVVSPALLLCIDQFAGPIEILGVPDSRLHRQLGPTLAEAEWRRQLDAYSRPTIQIKGGD